MLLWVPYARPFGNLMMIKHNGRILYSLWTYMYKCIYIRCSVQRTHCYSKDVERRDVIGPILVLNLTSYLICINILWWSCYIVELLLDISDRIEHGLHYSTYALIYKHKQLTKINIEDNYKVRLIKIYIIVNKLLNIKNTYIINQIFI